jgi:protein-L-isoaspartate O-methyltransferase
MTSLSRLLPVLAFVVLLWSAIGPSSTDAQVPDTISAPVEPAQEPWPDEPLPHPELPAETDTIETDASDSDKDAPYVPTPQRVVTRMLEAADVSETDVVFDLGSGDGRIPIVAAERFEARAVGVEIDSQLVARSREAAREAGVADRVEFRREDLFETDLSETTVVALYLWPEINRELRPKLLRALDPGDRIVSHDFRMGKREPDRRIVMNGEGLTGKDYVYLWTIPQEVPDRLLEGSEPYQGPTSKGEH